MFSYSATFLVLWDSLQSGKWKAESGEWDIWDIRPKFATEIRESTEESEKKDGPRSFLSALFYLCELGGF